MGSEEEATQMMGKALKPGAAVRLFHLQTNSYVVYETNEITLQLKLEENKVAPLGLTVYTHRIGIEEGVCDGDEVAILARPNGNPFSLAQDFNFKGTCSDHYVVRRFESFSVTESNDIGFGRVCKLRADNGMFLSLKPNSDSDFKLILDEEEMKEDYHEGGAFCYPEYMGSLRADLSTNGENGNCYWVIERENRFLGGRMKVGDEFYIRHVASGRYLNGDLTLQSRPSACTFAFKSLDDVPDSNIGYGEFNSLTAEDDIVISLDLTPSISTIKTQIFEPVVSDLDPNMVLRLPLSSESRQWQVRSLTFSCQQVENSEANVVVEMAMYLTRLSEMRLALQHLKKQPNVGNVLYGISNRILIGSLAVSGVQHTFLANIASDFQIVNELLRIFILMRTMFTEYEKFFTDVTFFVNLTNPMQNIQFYERVSRNMFENRSLLLALANISNVELADILQWALKAQPPKDEERLYWVGKYLKFIPIPTTYNEVTSLLFFCHFLMDRLPSKIQVTDMDFMKNSGNYILRFEKEDDEYFGYTYNTKASFVDVISGYGGFTATSLEVLSDLCCRTNHKEDIITGTGLDLMNCLNMYHRATDSLRVQMSLLNFLSDVHVPGSCAMVPLTEIADRKMINRASLSGISDLETTSEWFYFPDRSSPISDLLKEEVYFWLSTVHTPIQCDDPTTWYYNSVVHFRFVAKLIENSPVSDMFVASMVSSAVALTWSALNEDIEGFSERFPKLRDSKYRVETEKQRVVEELLDLLMVYQRWKIVKVLKKCSKVTPRTAISKDEIVKYLQELTFDVIFATFRKQHGIESSGAKSLLTDNSQLPALAQSFERLISNPKVTVKSILQHFITKTHYTVRGHPTFILDLIDSELDQSDHILQLISDMVDEGVYEEFLPMVKAIESQAVSHHELATCDGQNVNNLQQFLDAMEHLCDFMLELKSDAENIARYQAFLRKADFITQLKRAWSYCIQISEGNSEDSMFVQLRTITIEVSRLYVLENEDNKKQLLKILPLEAFYPDYPQYIQLLIEMRLLDTEGEIANSVMQVIFSNALGSDKKRFLLALKQLFTDKMLLSKVIFTIIDYYNTVEKEQLSNCEWEMLISASLCVPASERLNWLSSIALKWYDPSPENIRREGAAITIFAQNSQHNLLQQGMENTINHLTQINSRSVEQLESNFNALLDNPKTRRNRNFEVMDSDILYLFELFFEEKSGVVYHIPEWKGVNLLPNLVSEFANLYLKIADRPTMNQFSGALYPLLTNYLDSISNEESTDDQVLSLLKQVRNTRVDYTPKAPNNPNIPNIVSVFELPALDKMQRPMIAEMFSEKVSLGPEDFAQLKKLFLMKQAEEDYMQACFVAVNLPIINAEAFDKKEDSLMPVVKELLELAIVHKNEKMQELALKVLEVIVVKLLNLRPFIIECLKSRRQYMRFFSVFETFIERRRRIKERISEETTSYVKVLESRLESVTGVLMAFLNLFQKCCDGCFYPFQDYLRDQGDGERNSINIVSLTTKLLTECISKTIDPAEIPLIINCGKALVEMISGPCRHNQREVCRTTGFVPALMQQMGNFAGKNLSLDLDLLDSLVGQITVLIESNERDIPAIELMMGKVNFSVFVELSVKLAAIVSDADLTAMDMGLPVSEVIEKQFDIATKCMIVCFSTMKEEELEVFKTHRFLKYIATVDIQLTDEVAETIKIRTLTFRVPFIAQFLTSQTAAMVLNDIDRESRHVKLEDFTKKTDACEVEMRHQQRLSRSPVVKFFTHYWRKYLLLSFVLVVILNLFLIDLVEASGDVRFSLVGKWVWLMRILGIGQVVLITSGTVGFYMEYSYVLWSPMKKRDESKEIEDLSNAQSPGAKTSSFVEAKSSDTQSLDLDEVLKCILRFTYVALALAAVFYQFLYPFLLFQIVNLNDSIVNILKSVTHHGGQLMLTLLFALMVMFVYTFIAYFFLYEYYDPDSGMYCDTLRECFFSTVNMGMRSGGGLGDALGPTVETDFIFRLIFDLLFYISITTVLMAIVFGLIVDTFSELRDNKNAMEEDMNNVCMICGHKRSVIELKGEGWKKHILQVHNPFAYMYFLLYIKERDILDCSGSEKMVKECREAKDISFYPTTSIAIGLDDVADE